jgi:hypothetical protein
LIDRARATVLRQHDLTKTEFAKAIFAGLLAAACRRMDLDLSEALHLLALESRAPQGLRASIARKHAVYLTHWIAGIRQAEIARAAELSRVSVCRALHDVERQSDRDPEMAALLNGIARDVFPDQALDGCDVE